MISAQTVTKNSFIALGSSVIQKLLTLAYFIIVARVFGPEDQGRYSAAIAFATLFSVLIDLGLSSALTRETARTPERAPVFLGQMFLARLVLGILVYVLIVGSAVVFGYSSELISLIHIAGIAAVIDTITSSCWFLLRGFRNLFYESLGSLGAIAAMIISGGAAMILGLPVIALVYAVLFGSAVNLAIALATVFCKARMPLLLKPDRATLVYLALVSFPFAAAAIFSRITTFADVTILAKIAGETAVGWYAAGNKLILALNVIPGALSASIYPALSSYFSSAHDQLSILTAKALFFLLLISAPLGVGIAVTAPDIVDLFYGALYRPTIPILQLLGLTLMLGYCTFPLGALLAAVNRQKANAVIFGVAAFINVSANLLFIPRFGAFGSALSSALTMGVLLLLSLWATRAIMMERARHVISQAVRILFCAGMMGTAVSILRAGGVGFGVLIFVGVASYALCIVLTRVITVQQMSEIYASFLKSSKS